jgi:hypothetical protein
MALCMTEDFTYHLMCDRQVAGEEPDGDPEAVRGGRVERRGTVRNARGAGVRDAQLRARARNVYAHGRVRAACRTQRRLRLHHRRC